jgi:flagellar biosynthetic protein FliO
MNPTSLQGYRGKKRYAEYGDIFFWLCPPIVQRSGRFKTAHTACYLSAKAYGAACDELPSASSGPELVEGSRVVRRFETAMYRALFRGQSKKRYLHARFHNKFLRNALWALAADVMSELNLIGTGLRTVAMLSIVLGLLVLVLYLMKRFLFINRGAKGDLLIKILSSLNLSPKERIEVIEVSGEKIVLGITPGNITFLTKLNSLPGETGEAGGTRED